jgi:capsular polysaccharide biosynthesis protein
VVEWEHYLNKSPDDWATYSITQPHVLIGNMCGFSYYHFLFDIVPKLWVYDEWPELKQYPMIVGPMGDKFKQALADAIGIPFSQILSIPQGVMANLHFKHLIFPSALSDRMVTKEQIALIRSKIGRESFRHPEPGERRYRVYVSRADRPYHRIDSEAEIEQILKNEYGFIPVIGGQLSMTDQAALFSKAEMVVGAAAGGLANMVYMPPKSVFLELASREPFGDPSHRDIMAANDIRHIMLVASWNIHRLRRGDMTTNERGPTAMLFDMDRLRQAVEVGLSMLKE